jgi:hypothetical protein
MDDLTTAKGIGGHHSPVGRTDEWLTPPLLIRALGHFDLDPCAPIERPWPIAANHYTTDDDGLKRMWFGRVWLNPPYGAPTIVTPWLEKMSNWGIGTALIFARTETDMFFRYVWEQATALLFLRGRIHFHHLDGVRAKANSGGPSVLIAYGETDAEKLAESGIVGQFVRLR